MMLVPDVGLRGHTASEEQRHFMADQDNAERHTHEMARRIESRGPR